ncbi:hypothetical protein, partial [Staphylococcus aureus]|uniref:hypothetical protein n=1 Tax=Staphylococcus aureus TaxID=1280 RepID=UPI001D166C1B
IVQSDSEVVYYPWSFQTTSRSELIILTEFVKPTKTYAKSLYLSEVNHIDHETGYLMLWVVLNDLNL